MSGAAPAGLFLRRRPESLQGYVAQVVLGRLSDAEMGIDLRDRSFGDSHRRPACPVVAPWARELIRPLGKRTGARRVSIGLAAGPYRYRVGGRRAKAHLCESDGEKCGPYLRIQMEHYDDKGATSNIFACFSGCVPSRHHLDARADPASIS